LIKHLFLSTVGSLSRLVVRRKVQANAIDTVALIRGRGKALALEDVAQVAATVGADNLDAAHAEGPVLVSCNGSGEAVKVGRPAAARLEFVVGLVQRSVAPGTRVDALFGVVLVKLATAGSLGSLLPQDTKLFTVEHSTPLIIGALVWIGHVGVGGRRSE
jgi:hypothetical protein